MLLKRQVFVLFLACFAIASVAIGNPKPNVLFIAVDDLRPEIASFGAEQMHTPNLDRLASRGVRFQRAHCMVPTCGASRASLMSSIRPARDRFLTHFSRADEDVPGITTLNTHFKNHGYTTVSLGKIFHTKEDSLKGWSEKPWKSKAPTYLTEQAKAALVKDSKGRDRGPSCEIGGDVPDNAYADGQTADEAVKRLKGLSGKSDEPFFLAVGFVKPHLPFVAPKKYFDLYPPGKIRVPDNYYPPKDAPAGAVHSFGELRNYSDIKEKGILSREKAKQLIRGYYAATSYVDAQLGRVLDAFDELGLAENTIIVLWGDHGWNLGEHTLWCKHSCFETSVRAPLIFTAPEGHGVKANASTQSFVEFIDIYPTLCELAGLPLPKHLDGVSLVPVLKDPTVSIKNHTISRFRNGDTICTDRFRYTIYFDSKGKQESHMLYDHRADPDENTNIANHPEFAGTVKELAAKLEANKGRPGDFKH